MEKLDKKLDLIIERLCAIESRMEGLDQVKEQLCTHERYIYMLEKKVRKKNLLFFGIPEGNDGNDPTLKILDIINSVEGLECTENDIEACYRRGNVSKLLPNGSRPLVVEFLSTKMKEKIFSSRGKFERPVYVRLDFPPAPKKADDEATDAAAGTKRKQRSPLINKSKKPNGAPTGSPSKN